jgi:hypothetical protein
LTLICLITYFSTKLKWNRASPSPSLALALWQYPYYVCNKEKCLNNGKSLYMFIRRVINSL